MPILSEWATWLWAQGLAATLIAEIQHGGDVSGAWRVQTHAAEWAEIVQMGLSKQEIGVA